MKDTLEPRMSHASFKNKREYMFVADHQMAYITSRIGMDISVKSNLTADILLLADDWVREVANDIAVQNKTDASTVLDMLLSSL